MTEPRIDAAASSLVGADLESLERAPEMQPFVPVEGVDTTWGAFLLLLEATRGRVRDTAGSGEGRVSLERAGLLDRRGRLTVEGERIAQHARGTRVSTVLRASVGDAATRWNGFTLGDSTLVAHGPAPTAESAEHPAASEAALPVRVSVLPIAHTIDHAISWVGVQPVWSTWQGVLMLDSAVMQERSRSSSTPAPLGLPGALGRAWSSTWREWSWVVARPSTGAVLGGRLVTADGIGQWQVADMGDGTTRVAELTPSDLYDAMLDGFSAALQSSAPG